MSLAPVMAQADDGFQKLVTQPEHRARHQNRIEQEIRRWQGTRPNEQLFSDVRLLFNLAPRDRVLRPAITRMLAARRPQTGSVQAEELYYYHLLNLEPRSESHRQKLADLLLRKHGGHSATEIKNAYRFLNDAFNAWDEAKYDQAIRLFKQAHLAKSPELTALLASHLRDRGQVAQAQKILADFKGERSYLDWLDGLQLQINAAQQLLNSALPEPDRIGAWLTLGNYERAKSAIQQLPAGPSKHWHQAKALEKQGQYHAAAAEYQSYYHQLWSPQLKGFVPVVYKAQLEDINSLDLIALKFRTSPELIRQVNQAWPHDWVETYRMLVIPVAAHEMNWPASGYVSSHFGFRLHPIRGTWRLHEGIDIETRPGVPALAAAPGSVVQAGFDSACGNMIRLQHADPALRTVYCHGEKLSVAKGAKVSAGKPVLVTGNTGASASNHLHFGVQLNGVFVDPMDWL
ncbi:MAG: hypothetical protein CVV27_09205 [Candidatus Melainabacteria bacterium HGW-Melainabacteria-1]|nr:MAG: hypothetical protein CVV27_09205 [Candidatus Melainabacteria bacterium HGW-Melainabacteria-1]